MSQNTIILIFYKWTSIILVVISASQSHRVEMEVLSAAERLVHRQTRAIKTFIFIKF
jgi:hypothetical protein